MIMMCGKFHCQDGFNLFFSHTRTKEGPPRLLEQRVLAQHRHFVRRYHQRLNFICKHLWFIKLVSIKITTRLL